jgi:chromate transporter
MRWTEADRNQMPEFESLAFGHMTSKENQNVPERKADGIPSWGELFLYFLTFGFLSVGDPEAQIASIYSHTVEQRRWLSKERFNKILAFCLVAPGSEALQLVISVGYLKRGLKGGVLAGLLFILPGGLLMILLTRLYVTYGRMPEVNVVLFILKPAVLGILMAGVIKFGAAAIRNYLFAAILVASFAALSLSLTNLLLILIAGGSFNLLVSQGWPLLQRRITQPRVLVISTLLLALPFLHPHWLKMAWLFLKTGLFSFGGAYASLAFLQQGAVEEHRWVSAYQLLDGLALSIAIPGPFMLFSTYIGYLSGGLAGAILATFFVSLPSFVFVFVGSRYMDMVTNNAAIQSFLAGASAALVGVIIFITIEIAPLALAGTATIAIAISTFLIVALLKINVALVGALAMLGGIGYAFFNTGL